MSSNPLVDALRNDVELAFNQHSADLTRLYSQLSILHERSTGDIENPESFLKQFGHPVLFKNTFNYMQGGDGSFKSATTETMVSVLIAPSLDAVTCDNLGFERTSIGPMTVVHVDTERNHTDQYPRAMQRMRVRAGYAKDETVPWFVGVSLKSFPRDKRLPLLREFLQDQISKRPGHKVIVLDQLADLVKDFNSLEETNLLLDMLNNMADDEDVTVFGIIHENHSNGHAGVNPKARGHLGSEARNKATTAIQVSYDKDAGGKDNGLIRWLYLKCREAKKGVTFFGRYDEQQRMLVSVDNEEVEGLQVAGKKAKRQNKQQQVIAELGAVLQGGVELGQDVLIKAINAAGVPNVTDIASILSQLAAEGQTVPDAVGRPCMLVCTGQRPKLYKLALKMAVA